MLEPIRNDLIKITEIHATGELPELLRMKDGTPVKTPEDWAARRVELQKAVEYQFGAQLGAPDSVAVEMLCNDTAKPPRNYRIVCKKDGKCASFTLRLFIPKQEGKVPVIIDGDGCFHYAYNTGFVDTVTENGCALALFDRTELAADTTNAYPGKFGQLFKMYPGEEFGEVSAWAWGFSRVVDALEILCGKRANGETDYPLGKLLNDQLDLDWIAFTGHSRGGKTAFLAGINDARVAVVNSNEAGCGGTACHRISCEGITESGVEQRSETLADITTRFPDWFGPKLIKKAGYEENLPMDEHFLKAMVAPRVLLIGSAASDIWANPVGTVATNRAVAPVYQLLGAEEKLLWYFRPGTHAHTEGDVEVLCNVIKHFRNGDALWDGFFRLPYEETGDPFETSSEIKAPWDHFPCYRLTPDATPEEMRRTAIQAQHDELTVPWRPEIDMVYEKQAGGNPHVHKYYQNTPYGGLPYTAGGTGLMQWMEFIDPKTGMIAAEDTKDLCYRHGNSCAASVSWGEAAAVPSVQRCIATHSFVQKNGWFPLGEVKYDPETESFSQLGTDEIVAANGDEKILESYALLQPADVVVATHDLTAPRLANGKRRTGNHCMMAIGKPVVIRDEAGKIDAEKSYVIVQDQWVNSFAQESEVRPELSDTVVEGKPQTVYVRGHVYKTQSFASLLEEKYIAITTAEYLGLKKYENAWAKADHEITDLASMLEARVFVNFRITAAYLEVVSGEETVYADKYVLTRDVVPILENGLLLEDAFDVDTLLPVITELKLTGKEAKVQVSVRVATGEVLKVAEFEA